MKWDGNRQSDNVEDRRSESGGSYVGSGGGGLLGALLGGRRLSLGVVVVALLGGWALGISPLTVLSLLDGGGMPASPVQQAPAKRPPADDRMAAFVSTVLADTEDVWTAEFAKGGSTYQAPHLVLFRGATPTGCGQGEAAMGPFYCPADQKVYIDLGFYQTLKDQLGAPGDFAQAYVIAHEVGHHVQNLLGVTRKMEQKRGQLTQVQYNALSVRLELQADCLAGVWAHHAQATRQILETGDLEEAMNAAAKIGDDALQGAGGGRVVPESFTHGTSAQRQRWFQAGMQSGSVKNCDTFGSRNL
ncbi:MAG: neutral zinc metallopeptidase [Rhodoferax sp.]|nr:neutral zinc metallopeptidase [Rhodoferax sp.]